MRLPLQTRAFCASMLVHTTVVVALGVRYWQSWSEPQAVPTLAAQAPRLMPAVEVEKRPEIPTQKPLAEEPMLFQAAWAGEALEDPLELKDFDFEDFSVPNLRYEPLPVALPEPEPPPPSPSEPEKTRPQIQPPQQIAQSPPPQSEPVVTKPRLRPASCPELRYPRAARRRGLKGAVELKAWIDVTGKPSQMEVHKSSGHSILDKAALEGVEDWVFEPARRDGEAFEDWIVFRIRFEATPSP